VPQRVDGDARRARAEVENHIHPKHLDDFCAGHIGGSSRELVRRRAAGPRLAAAAAARSEAKALALVCVSCVGCGGEQMHEFWLNRAKHGDETLDWRFVSPFFRAAALVRTTFFSRGRDALASRRPVPLRPGRPGPPATLGPMGSQALVQELQQVAWRLTGEAKQLAKDKARLEVRAPPPRAPPGCGPRRNGANTHLQHDRASCGMSEGKPVRTSLACRGR
jgi:hypothetical protein